MSVVIPVKTKDNKSQYTRHVELVRELGSGLLLGLGLGSGLGLGLGLGLALELGLGQK